MTAGTAANTSGLRPKGPLQGRTVLVARPLGQAGPLAAALREAGADVLLFPGVEIQPCALAPSGAATLQSLANADWAIFASRNAVAHGLQTIHDATLQGLLAPGSDRGLPGSLRSAAVGSGTARALEEAGWGPVLRPMDSEDSEGLLRALDHTRSGASGLTGQRVVIFRGAGGRETLAGGLRARGAQVDYLEVYRRVLPAQDPGPVQQLLRTGRMDAICAMSTETLHNLFTLLGTATHGALRDTLWLLPHPRVADAARAIGVQRTLLMANGTDQAVLLSLIEHFGLPG